MQGSNLQSPDNGLNRSQTPYHWANWPVLWLMEGWLKFGIDIGMWVGFGGSGEKAFLGDGFRHEHATVYFSYIRVEIYKYCVSLLISLRWEWVGLVKFHWARNSDSRNTTTFGYYIYGSSYYLSPSYGLMIRKRHWSILSDFDWELDRQSHCWS